MYFDVQKVTLAFFLFELRVKRRTILFLRCCVVPSYTYLGAVVCWRAINKDKENAVKKSDKNKSIPKR